MKDDNFDLFLQLSLPITQMVVRVKLIKKGQCKKETVQYKVDNTDKSPGQNSKLAI